MEQLEAEWWMLIDGSKPGDHFICWLDRSAESEEVVEAFLRGAVMRNELLALILPAEEITSFLRGFGPRGLRLDRLAAEGYLHVIPADGLLRDGEPPGPQVTEAIKGLCAIARRQGNKTVSVLSKLSSPAFERGEESIAEEIEGAIGSAARSVRTMCVYEAKNLYTLRLREAISLLRLHTHSITSFGDGQIVAEQVTKHSRDDSLTLAIFQRPQVAGS